MAKMPGEYAPFGGKRVRSRHFRINLIRGAAGLGPRLCRSRGLGRLHAAHIAPRIGRGLGVRYFLQRFLVGLLLDRLLLLFLRGFGGKLRDQIDVGDLRVSRTCQQRDNSRPAENSHRMLPAFSRQHTTAPPTTPSARTRTLKMVRLAGFRRLHPIVPDRTAFGAAIEGKTHRDRAQNHYQSPEHGRPAPTPYHTASSQAFSSRATAVSLSAQRTLEYPSPDPGRGTTSNATRATGRGIRYRGSQARAWRCVRAVGAGPRVVDRRHRVHAAIGCGGRLAAGRDPADGLLRTAVPARRGRLRPGAGGGG